MLKNRIARSVASMRLSRKIGSASLAGQQPERLRGENRNYQKFVVLAHATVGIVAHYFFAREHPQMVAFSELFVPESIFFRLQGYDNQSPEMLAFRNARPLEFLDDFVFSGYREDIQAVGFKLFPDQIDNSAFRCVWKWLARQENLKIIYLTRRNLLATYTSLLVAQKDKRYAIRDQSQRSQTTVRIDPQTCLEEFEKRAKYEHTIEQNIERQDVLRWFYEELAAAQESQLKQAQEFLGVTVCDLKIKLVKQEVRPLREVIENYAELQVFFAGTRWDYLFSDRQESTFPAPSEVIHDEAGGRARKIRLFSTKNVPAGQGNWLRRPVMASSAIAISLLFIGFLLLQTMGDKSTAKAQTVSVIGEIAARIKGYVHEHRELPRELTALARKITR